MPRKESVRRKPLPKFGVKGKAGRRGAYVSVFTEIVGGTIVGEGKHRRVENPTGRVVRVQWTENGERLTRSWADTEKAREEARAFADGVVERLAAIARGENPDAPAPVVPLTLRELWERYLAAQAHWRPRTRELAKERWTKLELHLGEHTRADAVSRDDLDDLRRALTPHHEINQVGLVVKQIKAVFRFAVDRDHVKAGPAMKIPTYEFKIGKDEKRLKVPEYTQDEADKLLTDAAPLARDAKGWRYYVALHVFAYAGPRHNAAEHLTWADVDYDAGTLTWRGEWDKLGKEDRVQPVPAPVLDALRVAEGWALAAGYSGPWVFFRPGIGTIDRGGRRGGGRWTSARQAKRRAGKVDKPWTYSAALGALRRAEKRTKVPHLKYRGFHGLRRRVVNAVLKATGGNLVLAGQYIGDDDLRTLQRSYVRPQLDELRGVAGMLAGPTAASEPSATSRNAVATEPGNTNAPLAGGASEPLTREPLT